MEQEFDKEIDALLRKLPAGFSPDVVTASMHLEADDIAAFAENALPDVARRAMTLHLADCGRCRKILSETVLVNSAAEGSTVAVAAAPAVETVKTEVPWYRRFFLFPNLAYVMGGLVLVFSGFLGYVVLRNAGTGQPATVSQVTETQPAASGPSAGQELDYVPESSAANTMANAASTAANSTVLRGGAINTNSSAATANVTTQGFAGTKREEEVAAASAPAPPPTVTDLATVGRQPMPAEKSAAGQDLRGRTMSELSKKKDDAGAILERVDAGVAQERDEAKLRSTPSISAKKSAPVGPSRDQQTQFPNRAQNAAPYYPLKNAGGKKFERRDDGVWYDTAYRGQATTTVRRGTENYLRLDGGLRSIAESVGGTSVIVWNGKAYRIQ